MHMWREISEMSLAHAGIVETFKSCVVCLHVSGTSCPCSRQWQRLHVCQH
jgi:hypothetical protein